MRQRARILALAAVLALGPGCFVIDELDAGMELMKESSPNGGKKAAAEPAPEPVARTKKKPDARVALAKWWKGARTPTSGPKDGGPAADIVTCRLGGKTLFMTKTDCEVQGGKF